jgi:protein SCO1/2
MMGAFRTMAGRATVAAALACALALCGGAALAGQGGYGKIPNSVVDASIMRIDENKFLGVPVSPGYRLVDSSGREFALGEMFDKPLILVLSYFRCDGACPAINDSLRQTLAGVKSWQLGRDFRVLTVSFDREDTQDSLSMFAQHAGFGAGLPQGWTIARMKNPDEIRKLTDSIGFRFFWEPRDRVFLHPAVFAVVSPEARVTRFLYSNSTDASDIALSVTNALGNELTASNVVNFLVSTCYSYNFHEGRYSLNYPLFIAVGTLCLGLSSLLAGAVIMRRRGKK